MIRAVVDANLLVSFFISHRPPISELFDVHLGKGDWTLLTASVLLEELDRVLQYPRMHRYYTSDERLRFVALIAALGEVVEVPEQVDDISILSARQFLEHLRSV